MHVVGWYDVPWGEDWEEELGLDAARADCQMEREEDGLGQFLWLEIKYFPRRGEASWR